MTTRLAGLARQKEILLMRSALGRLRLRVATERVRGSGPATAASRLGSIFRIANFFLGLRRAGATVRYRTDAGAPPAYPRVSTKEQSK